MHSGFELFDHTADIGVRVRAADMAGLVEPATAGLYAVVGDLVAAGETQRMEYTFAGSDPATLLRDYLAEILFELERDRLRTTSIEVVEFTDKRLHVIGRMAPVDEERSEFLREVKAITYHELNIQSSATGWSASYIVDI